MLSCRAGVKCMVSPSVKVRRSPSVKVRCSLDRAVQYLDLVWNLAKDARWTFTEVTK